jgi:hypothetical protein
MKTKLLLTALASATVLIGGCAVYPAQDPYYDYDAPVVRVAPPPPQYEYIGTPPVVGHIWIGGYWNWVGARYLWVPGRWDAPRPGYHWAPHRWERQGEHWRPYSGRWERGDPPRVIAPPPRIEHRPPPPRIERRDVPHAAPPPPRIERREAPFGAPPPVMRQEPAPRMERDDRNSRGRDDRRDDRRGRDRDKDRDRDGDGRPDFRDGQRP